MDKLTLEIFWAEIPVGRENAATYAELCAAWDKDERSVRSILHELSAFDNGDNYILIRSGKHKGFYKTDDLEEIIAYKQECLNKGRSVFAPVKKCNRVLRMNKDQFSFENNLRVMREGLNMTQKVVCYLMRKNCDPHFDVAMLSKMENGICFPTPFQLVTLAEIYRCAPRDLIDTEIYF
ncbi:MAG: helix-turn-helix transcriptional regulator [Selenomonadaceae bacterium]|nr:helix-turn-helix transcriptional regulator [Selenomonadaceae bacterium]